MMMNNTKKNTLEIDLSKQHACLRLKNFSGIESIGCWTDGHHASLVLEIDEGMPELLCMELTLAAFVPFPGSSVNNIGVKINDLPRETWQFTQHFSPEKKQIYIKLPRAVSRKVVINFDIPDAVVPAEIGMNDDRRRLGFLLQHILVRPCSQEELQCHFPEQRRVANPYANLPDYRYWRRSVSAVEAFRFDPVTHVRFRIPQTARVGTAGSCFAQHIAKKLHTLGFNYLITEDGRDLPEDVRKKNNFGVFSARFGNIYTTTQLLQLFDEAFGTREPLERYWIRPDGRYIDPYRQQVAPDGFESPEALLADRTQHLEAVRRLFTESDVFVFTLGLTEAWRSKKDQSVFSAAPGVVGGEYNETDYEFINFSLDEVSRSLEEFLVKLRLVNNNIKVLLTVSPVPLIATYEDRSVLLSTVYSKSVLRIAAENAIQRFDWVDYFPSYEIITGSFSGGMYYAPDWREVNHLGVAHAMRCFAAHYLDNVSLPEESENLAVPMTMHSDIVCDEETLDAIR